jgi:hypothetical protein
MDPDLADPLPPPSNDPVVNSQETRAGAQPSLMAASLPAYSPGVRLVWDGERDMVAPSHRLVEERTQIAGG